MSDLESLYTVEDHEKGADCAIIDPRTGKPHGLVLQLVGCDSDTYRAADTELYEARIRDKKEKLTTDEAYDELVEKLVKCTLGWTGTTDKFSKSACRKLYRNSPPVFNQANSFVTDRDNFYRD